MGIDKFPQELYKSYRNYLMKRYYAFFHVFFLMEITKTEKKSHVFAVAPHAGAWIEIKDCNVAEGSVNCRSPCGERGLKCFLDGLGFYYGVAPHAGSVD